MDNDTKSAIGAIDSAIAEHYRLIDLLLQRRIALMPIPADDEITAKQILRIIESDYMKPEMSVGYIADIVCTIEPRVSTIINKVLGDTLPGMVNRRRILLAKHKMSTTDDTIKQIAYDVGFSDSHYFSRVFKQLTGYKATEFRGRKVA
jgi:AraC-like DNA-binding protein